MHDAAAEIDSRWVLGLDCADRSLSVALAYVEKGLLVRVQTAEARNQATHHETLIGTVVALAAEAAITTSEIKEIVLGGGPGSFTGLRIGFSFASGFVFGSSRNVWCVSSLAGRAWAVKTERACVLGVMSPGTRDQFFAAYFFANGQSLECLDGPTLASAQVVGQRTEELAGARRVSARLIDAESPDSIGISLAQALIEMRIGEMQLTLPFRCARGDRPHELADLAPDYVQVVQAKTIAERSNS